MKSLFFVLVALIAVALAIPTPARACNVSSQTLLQSAVTCPQSVAPAFLLAAPVVVQSQFAVQSVQSYAQPAFVQSFAAQSYGVGAQTFSVGRRVRRRGIGIGLSDFTNEVAIDPLTGLPVEVVDPLLGFGGRLRGNALGRRGNVRRGRRR